MCLEAANNIVQGWEVAYSRGTVSELSLGDRRGKGSDSASRDKSERAIDTVNAFTDDADGRSGYGVMVDVGGGVEAAAEGSWRGGWCGAERAGVGFIPPGKVEPGPGKRRVAGSPSDIPLALGYLGEGERVRGGKIKAGDRTV